MSKGRREHSLRKFETTFFRQNGCNKDDTDLCARWKGKGRHQDSYTDSTLLYPDARVWLAICKGVPVYYTVREDSGISKEWLCDYVVPKTQTKYCQSVSIVFDRALLWRIFDPEKTRRYHPALLNAS